MFSSSQISQLNSAKAEGEAWYKYIHSQVLGEIRDTIREEDLFNKFRMALFNDRDPVAYVSIKRTKMTNHPCSDPVDVHNLLLTYGGYETIADEIGDNIILSYKANDNYEDIYIKFRYNPTETADPPPILRISTPPLPPSEEELSPIRRRLDFDVINPEDEFADDETESWDDDLRELDCTIPRRNR
jgi:hypothetical protein